MSDGSKIEWTDATWNPVTGCTKVSPGCKHCYAERLAMRLQAMGNPRYRDGFDLTLHPDQLTLPLRWRDSRRIFVNSMSDLFHEDVPEDFIRRVFEVMGEASWHVFQVLTKRAQRLACSAPTDRRTWSRQWRWAPSNCRRCCPRPPTYGCPAAPHGHVPSAFSLSSLLICRGSNGAGKSSIALG